MHYFHKFILAQNDMFQTVPLSIIRSLFAVHSAMVYVVQVCRQLSSRARPSWWWTKELSETCRFVPK